MAVKKEPTKKEKEIVELKGKLHEAMTGWEDTLDAWNFNDKINWALLFMGFLAGMGLGIVLFGNI